MTNPSVYSEGSFPVVTYFALKDLVSAESLFFSLFIYLPINYIHIILSFSVSFQSIFVLKNISLKSLNTAGIHFGDISKIYIQNYEYVCPKNK